MNQQKRKVVKISALGEVAQITAEQQREETRYRTQCAWFLSKPTDWENKRTFRLSMTMIDRFSDFDPINILATILFRKLRSALYTPTDIIQGDVYISNETEHEIVDFTLEDFNYILRKLPG